jgi:hypothetical protein
MARLLEGLKMRAKEGRGDVEVYVSRSGKK